MGKLWPGNVLPSKVMFHPDIASASGGPAIGGGEQVVFSSAGRWKAQLVMSVRRTIGANPHARIRAARAMLAYMKGRSNTIFIGPYDRPNAPAAVAGLPQGPIYTTHSDGTTFSDGSQYAQFATPALLADAVAVGALSATITLLDTRQTIDGGQYFGFGCSELYLIDSVCALGDGEFAVTFWPTMRNAHDEGETVNFDCPTAEMRFASDDSGQLNFPLGYGTDMTLELVEAI